MTRTAKLQAARTKALEAGKKNLCVCGCGTKVRGWFAQGHDQRVRGMLQRGEVNASLRAALKRGLVIKHVTTANQPVLTAKAA